MVVRLDRLRVSEMDHISDDDWVSEWTSASEGHHFG